MTFDLLSVCYDMMFFVDLLRHDVVQKIGVKGTIVTILLNLYVLFLFIILLTYCFIIYDF